MVDEAEELMNSSTSSEEEEQFEIGKDNHLEHGQREGDLPGESKMPELNLPGKILVADDQRLNLEALKLNLEDIGLLSQSEFFIDGQQVFDYVEKTLQSAKLLTDPVEDSSQPIRAILLDF
jgi:PleD family two-component response regulator